MNISASQTSITSYYNQTTATREGNVNPRQNHLIPETPPVNQSTTPTSETTKENRNPNQGSLNELNSDEQRIVNDLKKRDAEVKAHEQAHIAAGGPYVSGGANYEYERGPDNQNYAVGGEVSIDVSAENTPEATIRKMQIVKRAALAPRDPSGQDRSVAAQAAQTEARARIELQKERSQENAPEDADSSGQDERNDTNISEISAGSRLEQQATTAYSQTEITTNPLTAFSNNSTFKASA